MSVQTTADDNRDRAIDSVKDAIKALNEIVIGECWGFDDYRQEYRSRLFQAMIDLIAIRKSLDPSMRED